MFFRKLHKDQRGLTLIELMVVSAILAVLATLTVGAVTGTATKGRSATKATDVNEVQKAIDRFVGDDTAANYPVDKAAAEVWTLTIDDSGNITAATKKTGEGILTPAGLPATAGDYVEMNFSAQTIPGTGETAQAFNPDMLRRLPRHAADDVTVPPSNLDTTVPAWLIDSTGAVVVAWPDDTY